MNELLDRQMLAELRDIMEDEFSTLMETFLTESEKQYHAIESAMQQSDADLVRRAAHSLKGSCGNIGAASLQQQCAELEEAARDARMDDLPALIQEVGTQLEQVCQEVIGLQ